MRAGRRPAALVVVVAATVAAAGSVAVADPAPRRDHPAEAAAERALAIAAADARAAPGQLAAARTISVPGGGSIHRFGQRVGGLPVSGAEVVVAAPVGAVPAMVADETVPGLDPSLGGADVSRTEAVARAVDATGTARLRHPASARLVVDRRSGK
jgi:hypothetical protein